MRVMKKYISPQGLVFLLGIFFCVTMISSVFIYCEYNRYSLTSTSNTTTSPVYRIDHKTGEVLIINRLGSNVVVEGNSSK